MREATSYIRDGQTPGALLQQRRALAFDDHDSMDDSKREKTIVGRAVVSISTEIVIKI
jgi:hypothetical protein